MNVIRLMHLEAGMENPLAIWELSLVKKGISRLHGKPPNQKLPITPCILRKLLDTLDMQLGINKAFWCACLIAFHAFLRKSSLLPKSVASAECLKALLITDVVLSPNGDKLVLSVRHTKTIQFGQRRLVLPISAVSGSSLCAVDALQHMLASLKGLTIPAGQPLFSYIDAAGNLQFLSHPTFVRLLKVGLCAIGLQASSYSGHSFRRGGCSHAFSLGIPAHIVKLRGDWRSNAYERYITISDNQQEAFSTIFSDSLCS